MHRNKRYLDDAVENQVTKSKIDSLKTFIEEQSGLIKDLIAKISILDEKLNSSKPSIDELNNKINKFEWKLAYSNSYHKTS